MKKRKKRAKNKSRKALTLFQLKKHADMLFSAFIKRRDMECQLKERDGTACKGVLQAAHLMSRRNMRLRYDEVNCMTLCAAHHTYYSYRIEEWVFFLYREFPMHFQYVLDYMNEEVVVNRAFFEEVITQFGKELVAIM